MSITSLKLILTFICITLFFMQSKAQENITNWIDYNKQIIIPPGDYTIKFREKNTTCVSDAVNFTIELKEKPDASIIASKDIVCAGDSVTLSAVPSENYLWSTGESTQSITVAPSETTTYNLVVEENGCTSDTSYITITVKDKPAATITTQDNSICFGEEIDLLANQSTSYSWNTDDTSQSITVSPFETTTYSLVVKQNGCTSDTAKQVIVVKSLPEAEIIASKDSINFGETVILTSLPADTYIWSTGDPTRIIQVAPEKTTTYKLRISKDGCESSEVSLEIYVNPLPVVRMAYVLPSEVCGEGHVTFFAQANYGYIKWYNSPVGGNEVIPPNEVDETLTFYAEAEDENGLKSLERIPVTIQVNPIPDVPAVPAITDYCGYSELTFTDNPESEDIRWCWQRYDHETDTSKYSNPYRVTYSGTVYLRALDVKTMCWSTAVSKITKPKHIPDVPNEPSVTNYCGKSILFYSNKPDSTTWFWQTSITDTDLSNYSSAYEVYDSGTYYIRSYDGYSHCWSEPTNPVIASPHKIPVITGDSSLCIGEVSQLEVSGEPVGISPWISSSPSIVAIDSIGTITALAEGTCEITYTNLSGCTSSINLTVNALPNTPELITVENKCGYSLLKFSVIAEDYTGWFWQTDSLGNNSMNFDNPYRVDSAGIYFLRGYNGKTNCWSNTGKPISANPKPIPVIDDIITDSRCGPGMVDLSAFSEGTVNWYRSNIANNGVSLFTGNTFSPVIWSDTIFYVTTMLDGCISSSRTPVMATVREIPKLEITPPPTVCEPPFNCDITVPYITEGSTPELVHTYWIDEGITEPLINPYSVLPGLYYIKGTDPSTVINNDEQTGCYTIKPISW